MNMNKKEPIRILHVIQRMEAGGSQAMLMNIYRKIDRNKIQFDFLVEYKEKQFYDDEIIKMGGRIYRTNTRKTKNIFSFQKTLRALIKKNGYKIIHVHAYTIGYFALSTAKKCGVPIRIAHSHNNNTRKDFWYIPKMIMQKLYTVDATDLYACSKSAGDYLYKGRKYELFTNAIDTEKFKYDQNGRAQIREELNINQNDVLIGNIGRLHPQKNQEFLIDLFEKYHHYDSNSKLLIVGDGPLEKDLRKKITKKKLEKSIIILKNRKDINKILSAIDIFVMPSLYEGLPLTLVEAQAAGLPIIASSNISQETKMTDYYVTLSLGQGIEKWVEAINQYKNKRNKNAQKNIIDAKYDINETASEIQNNYIRLFKETKASK